MKQVAAKTQTMSKVAHSAHTTPMPIRFLHPVHLVNTVSLKPSMVKQTDKQEKNAPIQPAVSSHFPSSSLLMPTTPSTPRLKTILYEERDTPTVPLLPEERDTPTVPLLPEERDTPTVPLLPIAQILTDAVHPSDLKNTPIPLDDKDNPDEVRSLIWQNSRAWRDYAHRMDPLGSTQGKSEPNKRGDASFGQAIKSRVIISSAIIILTLLVLAILIASFVLGKIGT